MIRNLWNHTEPGLFFAGLGVGFLLLTLLLPKRIRSRVLTCGVSTAFVGVVVLILGLIASFYV